MAGYQAPDFIERSATARAARQIALDKLRHKEAPDPAVIAERQKALAVREALAVEWRAARQLAAAEPKAAKSAATTPDPEKATPEGHHRRLHPPMRN